MLPKEQVLNYYDAFPGIHWQAAHADLLTGLPSDDELVIGSSWFLSQPLLSNSIDCMDVVYFRKVEKPLPSTQNTGGNY
jgi:hypothetical protein